MTAATTRDLIGRYFAALNARSISDITALVAEDVIIDVNQGGRRIGRESFQTFLIHMARCYRETVGDLVVMTTDDGSRAAAEYTVHGTYLQTDDGLPEASGQTYAIAAGCFFEVEDGRIGRITPYYNLEDWIAKVSAG